MVEPVINVVTTIKCAAYRWSIITFWKPSLGHGKRTVNITFLYLKTACLELEPGFEMNCGYLESVALELIFVFISSYRMY